jgi:hypothetical protein
MTTTRRRRAGRWELGCVWALGEGSEGGSSSESNQPAATTRHNASSELLQITTGVMRCGDSTASSPTVRFGSRLWRPWLGRQSPPPIDEWCYVFDSPPETSRSRFHSSQSAGRGVRSVPNGLSRHQPGVALPRRASNIPYATQIHLYAPAHSQCKCGAPRSKHVRSACRCGRYDATTTCDLRGHTTCQAPGPALLVRWWRAKTLRLC